MIVAGTAGHIDHGKTTLVKCLTGMDTDRLKEEKQRGITIELGFAPLNLPDGRKIGLVDVPGHERFIHHMIAGAIGVDVVVMVIAADEGIMPQTREHLAICGLLGITRGLVVLTKADLVDEQWLELVREDVADYLGNTFLKDAPILTFSATRDQEHPAFREEFLRVIAGLLDQGSVVRESRAFILPIDRVFSVKGFGTVVTGTVLSGRLAVNDNLEVLPGNIPVRARTIQVHGEKVDGSLAGTRTAINLTDVEVSQVSRGEVLATPGAAAATSRLVMEMTTVHSIEEPVKPRFSALLHVGTTYVDAEFRLLSKELLGPGETALVACHCRRPVVVVPGMRGVLRSFSPVGDYGRTLGGGRILVNFGVRTRPENLLALAALAGDEPVARVEAAVRLVGLQGLRTRDLAPAADLEIGTADAALQGLVKSRVVLKLVHGSSDDGLLIHRDHSDRVLERVCELLDRYHERNPRKTGMPREELRSQVTQLQDPRVFQGLVEFWIKTRAIRGDETELAAAGFVQKIDAAFLALAQALEDRLFQAGFCPPGVQALASDLGQTEARLAEVTSFLLEEGRVVRINMELLFHPVRLEELKAKLVAHLTGQGTITTQQFKEMTGMSRKFLIPLAEYFDQKRVTRRTSETERVLRNL